MGSDISCKCEPQMFLGCYTPFRGGALLNIRWCKQSATLWLIIMVWTVRCHNKNVNHWIRLSGEVSAKKQRSLLLLDIKLCGHEGIQFNRREQLSPQINIFQCKSQRLVYEVKSWGLLDPVVHIENLKKPIDIPKGRTERSNNCILIFLEQHTFLD